MSLKATFYQVMDSTPAAIEAALPKLLEKVIEQGHKVVVRCPTRERMERLNEALWTYDPASFLPHGTKEDGFAEQQPVYLTTEVENPNKADVLVAISGAEAPDRAEYAQLLDMFEASDEQQKNARHRWKELKNQEAALTYYAYENGQWQKKA